MFKKVPIDAVVLLVPSFDPLLHQSLDEPLDGARAAALLGLRTVEGQRHGDRVGGRADMPGEPSEQQTAVPSNSGARRVHEQGMRFAERGISHGSCTLLCAVLCNLPARVVVARAAIRSTQMLREQS
jgi:hypothetical protein